MSLTLIGLGVNAGDVSVSALNALNEADVIFLRTEKTASAAFLKEHGIKYTSFDELYDSSRTFFSLVKKIVKSVKSELKTGKNVVYAVDGAVSEDSAAAQLSSIKGVSIHEGTSKICRALSLLSLSAKGYTAVSAYSEDLKDFSFPLVVFDLDSRILASRWKLFLFDKLGEELPVNLLIGGVFKKIPLYELDRFDGYDYSTVLVVESIELTKKERFGVRDLFDILYVLRSPNGCPWDKAQTPYSIRKNMIEEAYELVDALNLGDDDKIKEEIGDVLMQAAFHTLFAEERGAFDRKDVVSELCKKLITRHTHVFGSDDAADGEAALEVWDKNKQKEKGYGGAFDYVSALPSSFPACMRAEKTYKRAKKSGAVFGAVTPEVIYRLASELSAKGDKEVVAGKFLFLAVALVSESGDFAEEALSQYIDDYLKKLRAVENKLKADGATFNGVDVERAYDEIKKP